ncbi:MSMEG_1061 family FMN-dependent PPOX-type flavoprotein [Streptomyces sp. NPDC057418]|uniref:MSMEG_1061 family FMN-dependent PPOX-type flavoprotein n=1 Tax=unclassified Streptomyces TaxID=2593676 RepID=UPI00369973B5
MSHGPSPTLATAPVTREGYVEIGSGAALRELLGTPHPIVIEKVRQQLDAEDLAVLADSSFCVLSTSNAAGDCDASPRGDVPGFVHVVDGSTIALPERQGNRRGDSLRNILENPRAGLLHLVPGSKEVLRLNGRARILTDAPFFDLMTVKGRRPDLAILVEIDEVFKHCPQSLQRSAIWQPETWSTASASAPAA